MLKTILSKAFLSVLILVSLSALSGCKSSALTDIFKRCEPKCTDSQSTIPLEQIKNVFLQIVEDAPVQTDNLTGRWVMLSASRYSENSSTFRSFTDLLFTKSMVLTEVGNTIEVSDCYNKEIYPLEDSGFTIPQDSIFFSSLYFENQNPIVVNVVNNKLLSATWTFTTPQETQETVEVDMYKVADSDSPTAVLGTINSTDDIYCYSFLNVFTSAEQLFGGQWIPGNFEIKEILLKIDPNSGDENIALGSKASNGIVDEYKIIYNQNIELEEYECFGENTMGASDDYLSFFGDFTITTPDQDCDKPLGESEFEVSIQ